MFAIVLYDVEKALFIHVANLLRLGEMMVPVIPNSIQ
jgi:hypothetical protein